MKILIDYSLLPLGKIIAGTFSFLLRCTHNFGMEERAISGHSFVMSATLGAWGGDKRVTFSDRGGIKSLIFH